jgi:hypothetical protein
MALPDFYLTNLRIKSGVPLNKEEAGDEFQPLYDDEFLSFILEEAALTHTGKPFMQSLSHLPLIFLLARKEIYTILAGAFAKNYEISSDDGKLRKDQPFEHYLKLIKQVDAQYRTLSSSSFVQSTPVLLTNRTRYAYRNYLNSPEPAISLTLEENNHEFVSFRLAELTSVKIVSFSVYFGDEPIYDMFEAPPINKTTSTLVHSTLPFTANVYKIDKGGKTPNYLGLLTKNRYGKTFFLEQFIGEREELPPQPLPYPEG